MNTSNKILIAAYSRAFRWLSIVTLAVMWSCASNEEGTRKTKPIDPNDPNANVLFEINVPKSQAPSTYALNKKEEDQIKTVEILLFKTEGDDKGYTGKPYYCDVIEDEVGEPSNKKRFMVALPKGGPYDVVILANSRKIVNDLLVAASPPVTVTEKADVLNLLTMSHSGKWISNTSDIANFVPFPMWGELLGKTVSENLKLETILTRMLAKIDVALTGDAITSLKLQEVHLINPNDKGHLVPAVANFVGERPTAPTLVSGSNTSATLVYESTEASTPEKEFIGVIYTFEAKKAEAGYLSDATCLVLKGTYKDGSDYYYRVDFGSRDIVADTIKYLDILRNMKYSVNINKVNGPGKGSLQDAIDNPSANIDAGIVIWNSNELPIVVWDNQNSLGFSRDEVIVGYQASQEVQIKVRTDYSGGWKVDKIVDISNVGVTWLTLLPTSGAKDLTTDLQFDFKENFGTEPRVCYIYISAGSLSHIVKVTQLAPMRMRKIVWDDYDGVSDGDTGLTSIKVVQLDGQTFTSSIEANGAIEPFIELDDAIATLTLTYMGYVLEVPANEYTYGESGENINVTDRSLIGKAVHLDKIREDMAGKYLQIADVSLKDYKNTNADLNNWMPIGTETIQFTGSYDGGSGNSDIGFTISHLNIDRPAMNSVGLFGYTARTAKLTKIHIAYDASNITSISGGTCVGAVAGIGLGSIVGCSNATSVKGAGTHVGGIFGSNGNTQISALIWEKIINCENKATATITGLAYVGGITGCSYQNIEECHNSGVVEATSTSVDSYAGGIAGYIYGGGRESVAIGVISNSTNSGAVTGASSSVGGICGRSSAYYSNMAKTYITNCENKATGTITGLAHVGGIVGYADSGIEMCLNRGAVESTSASTGSYVGGICGSSRGSVLDSHNYATIAGKYDIIGGIVGGFDYDIKNPGYYGKGFIKGCTNSGAISSDYAVSYGIGGIVGRCLRGAIINCTSLASASIILQVPGGSSTGIIGGIAGSIEGGSITDCTNNASISSKNASYVGGICGQSLNKEELVAEISNCVNKGNFTDSPASYIIGGICGQNLGNIISCSNETPIKGRSIAGGICGVSYAPGKIDNCHNTIAVEIANAYGGGGYVGGIAGQGGGTISNCTNNAVITRKETIQNDSGGIGGIVGGSIRNYSYFITNCQNLSGGELIVDKGSYLIGGIMGQLEGEGTISDCRNDVPILTDSCIGVGGIVGGGGSDCIGTIKGCHNTVAISGYSYVGGIAGHGGIVLDCTNDAPITGTLDDADRGGSGIGGIAGKINIEAKNCKNLKDGVLNTANSRSVGGIAGDGAGDISSCSNVVPIIGAGKIGGIAGENGGKIDDCHNTVTVTSTIQGNAEGHTGGIVGLGVNITNCSNKGVIRMIDPENRFNSSGGIVGEIPRRATSIISNCHNHSEGEVYGTRHAAGILGRGATILSNCTNKAKITASESYSGGIVATANGSEDPLWRSSITNCTNSGDILGKGMSAGICASSYSASVIDCSNTATVTSTDNSAAGILGDLRGSTEDVISGCWNTGDIMASTNLPFNGGGAAGIVVNHYSDMIAYISGCWNSGNITAFKGRSGGGPAAGIVASSSAQISGCWNSGNIKGAEFAGGISALFSAQDGFTAMPHNACYSTGSVTVTATTGFYIGAIIGRLHFYEPTPPPPPAENCYYSGTTAPNDNGGTKFGPDPDWPTRDTPGWDANVWSNLGIWNGGVNPTYPTLKP